MVKKISKKQPKKTVAKKESPVPSPTKREHPFSQEVDEWVVTLFREAPHGGDEKTRVQIRPNSTCKAIKHAKGEVMILPILTDSGKEEFLVKSRNYDRKSVINIAFTVEALIAWIRCSAALLDELYQKPIPTFQDREQVMYDFIKLLSFNLPCGDWDGCLERDRILKDLSQKLGWNDPANRPQASDYVKNFIAAHQGI